MLQASSETEFLAHFKQVATFLILARHTFHNSVLTMQVMGKLFKAQIINLFPRDFFF